MSSTAYLSNAKLKKAGVAFKFKQWQLDEIEKCADDPLYFMKNYYQLVHVDKGLVPFEPFPFQERMADVFHKNRFVICRLPRQMGKTSICAAYILWFILFQEHKNVLIIANKEATAKEILKRIKLAYENVPIWMQQGIMKWDATKIELENGSAILASATTGSAARGGSFNLVFLDEYAFVPTHQADEFFASVYPTISSGQTTKMIIVSTPNGMNHYYHLWKKTIEGKSEFVAIDVHWREHPARDDAWAEQQKKNTTPQQFAQEFECNFLGGEGALIDPTFLQTIDFEEPIQRINNLDIYHRPKPGHRYVICCDTAEGVGQDYSAFVVIDITTVPYVLAAKYKSKLVSPVWLPHNLVNTAKSYNEAYILLETATVGYQVGYQLWFELEYPHIFSVVRDKGATKLKTGYSKGYIGVKMTPRVKNAGCANLKALVESRKLLFNDRDIVEEFTNFIFNGTTFEAEEGLHDDLAMSLVLFGWLAKQPTFHNMSNNDMGPTKDLEEDRWVPFVVSNDFIETPQPDEDGFDVWTEMTVPPF